MYPQNPTEGTSPQATQNPYYGHYGYYQRATKPPIFAIIAFIIAALGFLLGWVPFLGVIVAGTGLGMSIIALVRNQLKGLSIAGICLSAVGALFSLIVTMLFLIGAFTGASSTESAPAAATQAPTRAASTPSASPTPAPTPSPTETATPLPTAADLSAFRETDERELAQIVKNPDAHVGEQLIIYGNVTQFDSATGTCSMRVNIGALYQPQSYDYTTNTIAFDAGGDDQCSNLESLIEDDNVKLWVMVAGSETYSTQIGGSTTAPVVAVFKAEIQ